MIGTTKTTMMKRLFIVASMWVLHLQRGTKAQSLPFAFNIGEKRLPLGGLTVSSTQSLPLAMQYDGSMAIFVASSNKGLVGFFDSATPQNQLLGYVQPYVSDIDTTNGGADQNGVFLRVGSSTNDLNLARDIIAGKNGTIFSPQAIVVATWNKVEGNGLPTSVQNTFQLALPYSETGEVWGIFSYTQLQYFQTQDSFEVYVDYRKANDDVIERFNLINDNESMQQLLSGTNCNRTGVYAHRLFAAVTSAPSTAPSIAPTDAPSKSPTNAPTQKTCGLFGWSIFCPFTFCGIFGRWLGLCNSD